jgi:hypothetical protein
LKCPHVRVLWASCRIRRRIFRAIYNPHLISAFPTSSFFSKSANNHSSPSSSK